MNTIVKKINLTEIQALKPHPLIQKLGLALDKSLNESMAFYNNEAKYFNQYKRPLITESDFIIGNITAWYAASTNRASEIEVDVLTDFDEEDLVRYINYDSHFFKRSVTARYRLFLELKYYMTTVPNGMKWSETLEGDMNKKIGFVTGYSDSTVNFIMVIGKKGEHLLPKLEAGEIALRDAYNICQETEKIEKQIATNSVAKIDTIDTSEKADEKVNGKKKKNQVEKKEIFRPLFVDDKPSIKVFDKVIELHNPVIKETSNSITYVYETAGKESKVTIKIDNLKVLKDIK